MAAATRKVRGLRQADRASLRTAARNPRDPVLLPDSALVWRHEQFAAPHREETVQSPASKGGDRAAERAETNLRNFRYPASETGRLISSPGKGR
jgi:hypothetical protein